MGMRAAIVVLAVFCMAPVCGGGDDDDDGHYECSCFDYGGTGSEISDNHDHKLVVPGEDFTDPVDGTYDITGEADHGHQVSYTGEQLETVSGQNSATEQSTDTGGHSHSVTLDCGCGWVPD